MKFFRIDLLTLLISLFILGSCKNPDSVGLPLDASQTLQANLIDTATIKAVTVADDSVQTNNIAKAPLAWFKDPVFGTTEANIAATINLPSSVTYTPPVGQTTIDSAVLVLPYSDGFYGDSLTTNYKVNVYQLTEPVVSSRLYSNLKTWSHSATVLGTKSFFPRPKSGFKITNIVTGSVDTQAVVKAQLRIKLDPSWALSQIFNATTSQLGTNSVFQNYIKGLYITLDKTQPGVGGTMFVNMTADSSRLDIYYHSLLTSTNTVDTEKVSFDVGNPHAVQIAHNYTGAASGLTTQLANTNVNASFNTLYLQGLSGLRAKISFPYIKKILAAAQATAGNDIVLNQAELVVTPIAGSDIPFPPTPRLTMYRNDIALQRQLIPDAYSGDLHFIDVSSFGGFYDTYHRVYHYVITGYIEDLMRGKLVDYGTYIAPSDTTGLSTGSATVSVTAAANTASRAIVGGDNTSGYKMKLNIIYNKVTK